MSKSGIVALIIGIALTFVGAAVVFFVLLGINFDFSKLNYNLTDGSSQSYVEKTYDITDSFDSIYIEDSRADITFVKSDSDKAYVESFENEDVKYDVKVTGKKLSIKRNPKNDLNLLLSFESADPYLTVYLPKNAYNELTIKAASSDITLSSEFAFASVDIDVASGDVFVESKVSESVVIDVASSEVSVSNCEAKKVKINTASGDITVNGLKNNNEVEVNTASGEIEMDDISTKKFNSSTASGEQSLKNVIAEDKMELHTGSGEIIMYDCDSKDIRINTASGDVYCELLSEKQFDTDTASGDFKISSDAYGENGQCTIKTASGDVTIELSK